MTLNRDVYVKELALLTNDIQTIGLQPAMAIFARWSNGWKSVPPTSMGPMIAVTPLAPVAGAGSPLLVALMKRLAHFMRDRHSTL